MTEVEVKLLLSPGELSAFRKKLARLRLRSEDDERNFILDTKDRAFSRAGCLLRVRLLGRKGVVTFKTPKQKGSAYKAREELQFCVGNGQLALKSLNKLGLAKRWRYDKHRLTYEHSGVIITVDTLPIVGTVVEIEGKNDAMVRRALKSLGLARAQKSNANYYELAAEEFRKRGEPVGDLARNGR